MDMLIGIGHQPLIGRAKGGGPMAMVEVTMIVEGTDHAIDGDAIRQDRQHRTICVAVPCESVRALAAGILKGADDAEDFLRSVQSGAPDTATDGDPSR